MNFYQIPEWFYTYSVILQFFSAITTSFVAYYSYKIYTISEEEDTRLFFYSFLFVSISYWSWLVLSFVFLEPYGKFTYAINISTASFIELVPIYFHLAFFILGLLTLVYKRLDIKNKYLYALLISLTLPFLMVAYRKIDFTYIISSVIIFFIIILYIRDYFNEKNRDILLLIFSFFLLLISSIGFIFGDDHPTFYVIGHVFMAISYSFILIKLLIIVKHEWKKT